MRLGLILNILTLGGRVGNPFTGGGAWAPAPAPMTAQHEVVRARQPQSGVAQKKLRGKNAAKTGFRQVDGIDIAGATTPVAGAGAGAQAASAQHLDCRQYYQKRSRFGFDDDAAFFAAQDRAV